VFAFFWSPDGSKLAYVTPGDGAAEMRWNILEVATGDTWPLVQFIPTGPQLTVFRFFDQFGLSHSMWSPDSKALVFAGTMGQAVQASLGTQTASDIIVSEISPVPLAKPIAKGLLAVWSPR
jgi:Tol biopolymer transport system component